MDLPCGRAGVVVEVRDSRTGYLVPVRVAQVSCQMGRLVGAPSPPPSVVTRNSGRHSDSGRGVVFGGFHNMVPGVR